jgi:protein tyrosine phosphatase (PTP) superfamily phosphohydrolase (DUF442 family)
MTKKFIDSSLYKWLLLFYFFITVFFPLGFYTLLAGPSKWVVEAALKNSWSEQNEKFVQRLIILGLLIVSLILALIIRKFFASNKNIMLRYSMFSFITLLFLISTYIFSFEPDIFVKLSGKNPINSIQTSVSDSGTNIEFVLGAYPDLKELRRLKAAGYTGIVSLLNELVVPAEPNLIREEEKHAKTIGINLIRIPMLPWVSGNNESIEQIHKLVKTGHGKYFVHCYLGRDRVNVFRKIVRDLGANSSSLQKDVVRHIEDLKKFERGPYTKLYSNIYLTPFPTDDEFFGYIVNGQIASVISLLNPKDPADTAWISREKRILLRYGVKYINFPILDEKDKKGFQHLIDSFPKIKRPIVIYKYSSSDPLYKKIIQQKSLLK